MVKLVSEGYVKGLYVYLDFLTLRSIGIWILRLVLMNRCLDLKEVTVTNTRYNINGKRVGFNVIQCVTKCAHFIFNFSVIDYPPLQVITFTKSVSELFRFCGT